MKKGSALLIVLGMVSFMVVSAVGFSIYMRESRAPSSHLRRESSARYLLKSALANAIECLDGQLVKLGTMGFQDNSLKDAYALAGVYDDVYPGLRLKADDGGNSQNQNGNSAEELRRLGDYWNHRVFTPFGTCGPLETVATLTLEGLAYLPPALINEARVFSRTTRTARWHNLPYDLGRYAFCAIDVSDCFDINKVYATGRRTSAASERVTLGSLFPSAGSELDKLFGKANNVPFVSVADFNIAAGNTKFTPFVKYIGSSGAKIYSVSDAAAVSNALFVTDTWFPETNDCLTVDLERKASGTAGYDLSSADGQPFNNYEAQSFMHVTDQTRFSRAGGVGMCNLGMVGLACLYDYLDRDSVPISYCLPCTETAPMVCGLGVLFEDQFKPVVKENGKVEGTHDTGRKNSTTGQPVMETITSTKYVLEIPEMNLPIKAVLSFPFKRTSIRVKKPGNYKVMAVAKIFLAPADMKCRLDSKSPIYPKAKEDWEAGVKNGIVTVPCNDLANGSVAPMDMPKEPEDTLFDFQGVLRVTSQSMPLYWKVEDKADDGGATLMPAKYYSRDAIAQDESRLMIYDENGVLDETWSKALDTGAKTTAPVGGTYNTKDDCPARAGTAEPDADLSDEVVPHVAVWLRIEQDGEVVDIVPACPADDILWGQRANVVTSGKALQLCGDGSPVLDFRGAVKFKIGKSAETALTGAAGDPFAWKQMYAVDPRYNWAPENWFAVTGGDGDATKKEWVDSVVKSFLGQDGRDRDVFMFTSDQEYLQSIGELQFIPLVQRTDGRANGFTGDWIDNVRYNGEPFDKRSVASGGSIADLPFACKDFMWRTYCAYFRSTVNSFWDGWDNPYELSDQSGNIVSVIAGKGDFRLNPFSRDPRISTAAVLNTPYDYYVASTNEQCNGISPDSPSEDMCFGQRGSCEKWDEIDVQDIAGCLSDAFYEVGREGKHDFTEAMYDLAWDNTNEKLIFNLAEELADPLHSVDRKFLFSFWRECFQNRQQLFLVFIRAEPLTVGGSTGDALANSQLGARGVALVWRDPAPPTVTGGKKATRNSRMSLTSPAAWRTQNENTGPHRTRVLFYHQFD